MHTNKLVFHMLLQRPTLSKTKTETSNMHTHHRREKTDNPQRPQFDGVTSYKYVHKYT